MVNLQALAMYRLSDELVRRNLNLMALLLFCKGEEVLRKLSGLCKSTYAKAKNIIRNLPMRFFSFAGGPTKALKGLKRPLRAS